MKNRQKRLNGYSHFHLDAKKNRKRQEAIARQRDHLSLSFSDRIVKAKSRRGESKKEIARLVVLESKATVKPEPGPTVKSTKVKKN